MPERHSSASSLGGGPHLAWQGVESGASVGHERLVRGLEVDPNHGNAERVGHHPGIGLVARIAPARHDHARDLSRRRELTEPRHHRRINPPAQADDKPARRRRCRPLPEPADNLIHKSNIAGCVATLTSVEVYDQEAHDARPELASSGTTRLGAALYAFPIDSAAGESGQTTGGAAV